MIERNRLLNIIVIFVMLKHMSGISFSFIIDGAVRESVIACMTLSNDVDIERYCITEAVKRLNAVGIVGNDLECIVSERVRYILTHDENANDEQK
jgi:hypothetical protein